MAGTVLAEATRGAYSGFHCGEDGELTVIDDGGRRVAVPDVSNGALRRCIGFILRVSEALSQPRRPIVLDDVLCPLDADAAAPVAAAIGAIAATRPVVYVAGAATRSRALALLPAAARVLEVGEFLGS
jgi:hypothetical protein